ncbi:Uncharacterised protein [Mycobacteroides abscessus subsp. abscessus]|nr:Uncharacterised protein [Mycobacteroides abscessus subsp. abscessus]
MAVLGAATAGVGSGAPEVTTASKISRNCASSLACTCTEAPPGCGVSVVVRVPAAGTAPCAREAPTVTSASTCAAAARTSSAGSVTALAWTSHTCLPSGSATCAPGTRPVPLPVAIRAAGQNSLRTKVVRGMSA